MTTKLPVMEKVTESENRKVERELNFQRVILGEPLLFIHCGDEGFVTRISKLPY